MLFGSYNEFVYVLLFVIAYNAFRQLFAGLLVIRKVFYLIGSFLILRIIVDDQTLLILSVLMLIAFVMGKLLMRSGRSAFNRRLLAFSLVFFIGLFAIRNYSWITEWLINQGLVSLEKISIVGRIGLSYILFRLLHFLVDAYRGELSGNLNVLSFYNYIFFFPTYLSGPIDRYNNFEHWETNTENTVRYEMLLQGISRIFVGAIKKMMLVPLILPFVNNLGEVSYFGDTWLMALFISTLAYSFYIYFDFSGYSDIAIGTAYLIGIKTPENFNNPYLSSDISEFWKKWHISFSSILGEYVFKPFVVGMSQRFTFFPRLAVSITGYLYTFVICGLWHGSTLNFVYWGLWHGIGLAIFKTWQTKLSPRFNFQGISKWIRNAVPVLLTFVFVTIGWYFFSTSTAKIHAVFANEISYFNDEYSDGSERGLKISEKFYEGYGKGILVNYKYPDDALIEVQYKLIGADEWNTYVEDREGSFGFLDIHGSIENKGTTRNLTPGIYAVRVKEKNEVEYYGDLVLVSSYKE